MFVFGWVDWSTAICMSQTSAAIGSLWTLLDRLPAPKGPTSGGWGPYAVLST